MAAPSAAARSQAEAKALEAKAYFTQGLFEEAAMAFMEAFAISRAPDMMFNAARAYEEAKRPEKARALFKTYVGLDGVSDQGRQDAARRIALLEEQLAKDSAATEPLAAGDGAAKDSPVHLADPATSSSPGSGDAKAATGGAVPRAQGGARARSEVDALGWGVLAGGGALMAVAGLVYLGALSTANDANALEVDSLQDAKDYNKAFDKAEQMRAVSVGLVAAGAGLAAWGAWRLWLRPGDRLENSAFWLAPSLHGQGFAIGGRF
jgi:tetratricopeptide (TPR) repeat protein